MICLVAIFMGAAGALCVARLGHRVGLMDRPNARSSHHKATPKGGGIGILVAFCVVSIAMSVSPLIWVPVALVSVVSLLGDRLHLPQLWRLGCQLAACCVVTWAIVASGPKPGDTLTLVLAIGGASIFISGTANFYNFMDGINGIAGLTAVVALPCVAHYRSATVGADPLSTVAITVACATVGFLPFNLPRARVFMGDVGSILLGTVFGVLVIATTRSMVDFVCLCAFLFPFYADELSTMLVRIKDGENLLLPHRRHVYQILANQMGYSHLSVALGYALLQLGVAMAAMRIASLGFWPLTVSLTVAFGVFFLASVLVRKHEGPR